MRRPIHLRARRAPAAIGDRVFVKAMAELTLGREIPWAPEPADGVVNFRNNASVAGLFAARNRASWSAAQRDRENRQFVIMESGFAIAETEGRRWAMASGSVLALPPGVPHAVRFSRGAKGRVVRARELMLLARVSPVLPEPAPSFWRVYVEPMVFRYWEGRAKLAARDQLFREVDSVSKHLGPGFEGVVVGYLMVVLFKWMDPLAMGSAREGIEWSQGFADKVLLDRFRAVVERTFPAHFTVAAYCQALGVSKSRLARTCAEIDGRSPLEIVHDRRILEAQRDLIYSDASMADIAAGLGFRDPSYFVRFFVKRVGVTPLQFRATGGAPIQKRAKSRPPRPHDRSPSALTAPTQTAVGLRASAATRTR